MKVTSRQLQLLIDVEFHLEQFIIFAADDPMITEATYLEMKNVLKTFALFLDTATLAVDREDLI